MRTQAARVAIEPRSVQREGEAAESPGGEAPAVSPEDQRARDLAIVGEVVRGAVGGRRRAHFRALMLAAGFADTRDLESAAWLHFEKLWPFPARHRAWFYAVLHNFLVDEAQRETRFRRRHVPEEASGRAPDDDNDVFHDLPALADTSRVREILETAFKALSTLA
jgi:hypothetical protein